MLVEKYNKQVTFDKSIKKTEFLEPVPYEGKGKRM